MLLIENSGGRTEIRTQERVAPLPVFKTGAFNHSAILPFASFYKYNFKIQLKDLEELLDVDDTNLYNFYNGLDCNIKIKDNYINSLFKDFIYIAN